MELMPGMGGQLIPVKLGREAASCYLQVGMTLRLDPRPDVRSLIVQGSSMGVYCHDDRGASREVSGVRRVQRPRLRRDPGGLARPCGGNRFTRLVEVKQEVTDPPDAAETLGKVLAHREARLKRYFADLNARIDAPVQRAEVDPGAVGRLVTEVRLEMVLEALERSEQAAWEGRMDINAVLDPVPVRVDARMRPVTPEQSSS